VRSDAKASSTGPTSGSGASLGSLFRGAFVASGASSAAPGSSASSSQRRITLLALAIAILTLLALAPLSQAKVVVNGFGPDGSLGGQIHGPQTIDVNQTGNGAPAGTIYVADGNRIQRFSLAGAFELLWGWDVVKAGGVGDVSTNAFEICTVAADCKDIGGEAGPLGFNALKGVAINQATGHVYVAPDGRFRVMEFDASGNFVRLWGWDVVKAGGVGDVSTNAFEICTVAADCKGGKAGANGGQIGTQGRGNVVVDVVGNVWIADPGNRRVQEFDSAGNFIAAYGHNVDALGGGGGLEKCTSTATGACQAGTQGSGAGQFAGGGQSPNEIAFDSAGDLYAIDVGNSRMQKFDPTLTTATTFAASTFAAYTSSWSESMHVVSGQGGTRLFFSLDNNVTANPPERQIIEVDPTDGSVKDTSLVGSGLQTVNGLAQNDSTGTLYATTFTSLTPFRVLILGAPLPEPVVALDAITVKTDTTATFTASIDPKGGLVGCKFEYSTDQSTWIDAAPSPSCSTLAVGGGAQTISASVSGLIPNQRYYVRLQTSRPLVPNSIATSFLKSFDTDAPPPVVTDVGAVDVADTSARMVATIDPRHSSTGYVFEYGTTPALGSSTAPLEIGAGTAPITVSQSIPNLTADTTYYFRVVATNLSGTTTSASKTLHTRSVAPPLPEDRAYEQVSPPEKNYTDINNNIVFAGGAAGASLDGDAVGFCTTALFGDPTGRMTTFCAQYVSRRTAGGWQTTNPFPNYCHYDPDAIGPDGTIYAEGTMAVYPSVDFSRFVLQKAESAGCPIPPLDPAAPMIPGQMSYNLYRQDFTTNPFDFDLLNPEDGGQDKGQNIVGGSDDFSHVVYQSDFNQTTPPDSPEPNEDFRKLYEWEQEGQGGCAQPGGCLSLVSRDTSNEPFATPSSIATMSFSGGGMYVDSAVSGDGERIFFQNPVPAGGTVQPAACANPGCEVYMREDGAVTHDVSASECTVSCGSPQTVADVFISATSSGAAAFFTSCAKLTDESAPTQSCEDDHVYGEGGVTGSKLYRWDRNAPPGSQLVDLTVDHEPGDGSQPDFGRLFGHSEDGNTAYFTAGTQNFSGNSSGGQLISGEPVFKGEKLYRWQWNGGDPIVEYLGPYKTLDGLYFQAFGEINSSQRLSTVTPDGKYLQIYTELSYDPVVDRDVVDGDPFNTSEVDVYRWDEAGGWICISCQPPDAPSGGGVSLDFANRLQPDASFGYFASTAPIYTMSDDGRHIFFATPEALVPEDVNGEVSCPDTNEGFQITLYSCQDVYEWHDGTVSMVSSGTDSGPVRLIGSTPSARDVFFYTRERLVGWDADLSIDIYNARIGGGFPEPPAQPPSCEGESCRGARTSAPVTTSAGTAAFQGPGDAGETPRRKSCKRGYVKSRGGCVKKRNKKGSARRRAANNKRRATR
jgi:hypothetical protein